MKINACYSHWSTNNDRHRTTNPQRSIKAEVQEMINDVTEASPMNADAFEGSRKECDVCGEKFYFVTRLVAHLRMSHGILRPFKCRVCGKTYPHQFLLNAHVKKIHTPKTVGCEDCGFMGVSLADVERHKARNHRKEHMANYACALCGQRFADETSLVEHTAMHDFMEFQQCQVCGSTFNDASTLGEHNRRYHYDPTGAGEMELSGGDSSRSRAIVDNPENRCEICDKSFKYKSILKQHRSRSHGQPGNSSLANEKRRYLCALCGKELKTAKGLEIHNRSHTGEKPYTCEICGKCFACETLLRTHNVTHTGERKYRCDQCGKSFTQRSTLVVHKRYHSGERPYVCTRCGKGFVTRTVLKTHGKSCRL